MSVNQVSQREIDRLVGGELGNRECRELVARLELDPTAWRRCALAFLEERSLRRSLQTLVEAESSAPNSLDDTGRSSPRGRPRAQVNLNGSQRLVAGFENSLKPADESTPQRGLAERTLRDTRKPCHSVQQRIVPPDRGVMVNGDRAESRQPAWCTRPQIARGLATLLLAIGLGFFIGRLPQPAPPGDRTLARQTTENGETDQVDRSHRTHVGGKTREGLPSSVHLVGQAQVAGHESRHTALPVLSGPGLDEGWLSKRPAVWSPYEREQLLRRGLRVFEQQQVVTVQLSDGRRFSIPIDLVGYQLVPQRVS